MYRSERLTKINKKPLWGLALSVCPFKGEGLLHRPTFSPLCGPVTPLTSTLLFPLPRIRNPLITCPKMQQLVFSYWFFGGCWTGRGRRGENVLRLFRGYGVLVREDIWISYVTLKKYGGLARDGQECVRYTLNECHYCRIIIIILHILLNLLQKFRFIVSIFQDSSSLFLLLLTPMRFEDSEKQASFEKLVRSLGTQSNQQTGCLQKKEWKN